MSAGYWVLTLDPSNKILKTQMWNGEKPLPLGFPVRWILEKHDGSHRVRDLGQHKVLQGKNSFDLGNNRLSIVPRELSAPKKSLYVESAQVQKEKKEADKQDRIAGMGALLSLLMGLAVSLVADYIEPDAADPAAPIPQKYVKVVLKSARMQSQSAASSASRGSGVKSKAVAQKAKSLVRGGLKSLIRSGSLMSGATNTLGSLVRGAPSTGELNKWSSGVGEAGVSVASTNNGKGFGTGASAAKVGGQGNDFVALDWANAEVEEGLTRDEVGKVIHAHLAEIRYCYESSMIHNPSLGGRVLMDFTINGSGVVSVAKVKETTANDQRLEACITQRLQKWAFPKPKGGVKVAVSYPFLFKSLGG